MKDVKRRKRNGGIRKRCRCSPKVWAKCPHPWHLNFKWKDKHHRLSLDKEAGERIEGKGKAQAEADRIRTEIRAGRFRAPAPPAGESITFAKFATLWAEQRGCELVRSRDNDYRLKTINAFFLPAGMTFGEKPLTEITTEDIEAFRDARKAEGLSPVTVNHDLKLLRKMFNWGIRKRHIERTPFKIGTEPAITLQKETPRVWRFAAEEDEKKLLDVCDPHLKGVVIALLDTACRVGEILTLQWKNVNLERRELVIEAVKSKTRTTRMLPISTRLKGVLEMRQYDPAGERLGPEAYVFGNEVGERMKSVREPWETAREAAGFTNLQLRDLRHEAGSRFDEAGVPTNYISKILGHTNLTTTSRYLNIHRRGLQLAMQKLEQHQSDQKAVAQALHTDDKTPPANVPDSDSLEPGKPLPS